ncbi:MAG: hypothetical protein ACRCU2_17490, partial [Planktothrix sp.]
LHLLDKFRGITLEARKGLNITTQVDHGDISTKFRLNLMLTQVNQTSGDPVIAIAPQKISFVVRNLV